MSQISPAKENSHTRGATQFYRSLKIFSHARYLILITITSFPLTIPISPTPPPPARPTSSATRSDVATTRRSQPQTHHDRPSPMSTSNLLSNDASPRSVTSGDPPSAAAGWSVADWLRRAARQDTSASAGGPAAAWATASATASTSTASETASTAAAEAARFDQVSDLQRQDILFEISSLVHQGVVSNTLESRFR